MSPSKDVVKSTLKALKKAKKTYTKSPRKAREFLKKIGLIK